MIALLITVGALIYIGCGVLAYGFTLGYFQRHYWAVRDHKEVLLAVAVGLTGPAGLALTYLLGEFGYHGTLYQTTVSSWVEDRSLNDRESDIAKKHLRKPDEEAQC